MGNSLLEFESVGGHGCNRDAKVGEEVRGCGKMGCPDCEAKRAVEELLRANVGTFVRARFVHWPGDAVEVVDEMTLVPLYEGCTSGATRLKVVRRKQDFFRNRE
jgi:hypothetical protein